MAKPYRGSGQCFRDAAKSSTRFEKEVKGNSETENFVLELRETYWRQRITFFDEM